MFSCEVSFSTGAQCESELLEGIQKKKNEKGLWEKHILGI